MRRQVGLADVAPQQRPPQQVLAGDFAEPPRRLHHEREPLRVEEGKDVQREVVVEAVHELAGFAGASARRLSGVSYGRLHNFYRVSEPQQTVAALTEPRRSAQDR